MHIAILAPSEEGLHEFYKTGIANGGKDNGEPGPRSYYPPNLITCFVVDLDDNNIEVNYPRPQ